MHEAGVLNRDIKASNVLLHIVNDRYLYLHVIDYKCSVGLTGTGFWWVPKILEQVKRRVPNQELVWHDVYSIGMMCYEVVTGCIPFEVHPPSGYNVVLCGGRPRLPRDLNPRLKEIIADCWQQ